MRKQKTSASIISQSFHLIWIEFSILLRLISVMSAILILSYPYGIQGRELYLCDFAKKNRSAFNFGLYSSIYRPISFKHGMIIGTAKLCILICLDDLDPYSRSQLNEKSKIWVSVLSEILRSI